MQKIESQRKMPIGISFNAGGIRGYFSALIAQQLERDIGIPLNQFVDVFSGVSIGCILSTLYAIGVSSDEIVYMFENQGKQIFKPKFYYKWGVFPIKGPRYCSDSLQEVLTSYLQEKTLKDVKPILIGFATDITDSSYPFCNVFSNQDEQYKDLNLVDMTLSSSSAPTYFAQHVIGDRTYIDGGISNCDPSLQCFQGLSALTENALTDSILINIGTGIYQGDNKKDNSSKWNDYYLIHGLTASLSASQSLTRYTTTQLYKRSNNLFTLDTILTENIELDDLNSLSTLKELALQVIASEVYKECVRKIKQNIEPGRNNQYIQNNLTSIQMQSPFEHLVGIFQPNQSGEQIKQNSREFKPFEYDPRDYS